MKIKHIHIENFRGIEKLDLDFEKDISLFIGNNGMSKTTVLEAINYCCSESFSPARVKYSDFYNNTNDSIIIKVEFDNNFKIIIPDGYTEQEILCNSIELLINKRKQKTSGKLLSDNFVVEHYAVPIITKDTKENANQNGYEFKRKSGTIFKFLKIALSFNFSAKTEGFPKVFYFNKDRTNQIKNNGFNSSLSSLFDDFNWNFYRKNNATDNYQKDYLESINAIEKFILDKVDQKILPDVKKDLNDNFKLDNLDLSFFNRNEPFNQAWLSQKVKENFPLPTNVLGSGMEMIITIIFLMQLAQHSKDNNIILLLDEPEINLHPDFQINLIKYLKITEKQIFFSTHSPYFVKECFNKDCDIWCAKKKDNLIVYTKINENNSIFPYGPTYAEINYYAYNLYSDEFHNELYGYLMQLLFNNQKITELTGKKMNTYINSTYTNILKKYWVKVKNGNIQPQEEVPLFDYIRNYFHHPENKNNKKYSDTELKQSIEDLISIINNEK